MIVAQLTNAVDGAKAGIGWAVGKILGAGATVAMAPLNAAAKGVADAVGTMLTTLGTLWLRLDTPDVWNGSTSSVVAAINSEVAPLVALLAVLGIIIGAARLAWEQHSQRGFEIVHGLIVLVLVTGMGVPTLGLLTAGSDAWAMSIIDDATAGTDFGRNLLMLITPTGALAPVLVIIFGLFAILLSIVQIMLLAFRAAALVLMAGLLPVTAAATTTAAGQAQFRKVVAWAIALAAYKPLAALIYATAIKLVGTHNLTGGGGVGSVLIGLTMMLTAVLALPALLKLLVPAMGALHPGAQAAPGAMPKGAKAVKGLL